MKNNKIFRRKNNMNFYCRQFKLTAIGALLLTATFPALADDPDLRVCDDKGYRITTKTAATGVDTYQWYEDGVSLGAGYTTETISFTAGERGPGVHWYVRKASNATCTEVSSNTFTVEVLALPDVPAIAEPVAVCAGAVSTVQFTITPATNTTYTWTLVSGTAGAISGDDRSTYTVNSTAAGTTEVQAKASKLYAISGALPAKTCESALSTVAKAIVNPLPVVSPTGVFAQCGGGTFPLGVEVLAGGVDVTAGSTIKWYSDATGNTQVETGASYTTPSLTATTPYYVGAVVNATSCASASPLTTVTATVSLYEGEIDGTELP